MRIVFIAAGPFGLPTLESLIQSSIQVPLVITQPDRKSGRGRRVTPTPVNRAAAEHGLTVVTAADVNTPELIDRVRACSADVGVVVDFGQKIGPAFRAAFRGGCINLHASLLPRYRGAAPYQWAIIRGESATGVTVFKLVDRMDAGNMLARRQTTIGETETAAELHDRLSLLGPDAVLDAVALFDAGAFPEGERQDDRQATTAPKLRKEDGVIDFADPAESIVRRILGVWPWPGARCRFASCDGARDETVTLARARVAHLGDAGRPPGTIDDELRVAAADGMLEILEIKPQSGRLMSWPAYTNGRHVKPADRFIPIQM